MTNLTVLAGGHAYVDEPFREFLAAIGGGSVRVVTSDEFANGIASELNPGSDVALFYDMLGTELDDSRRWASLGVAYAAGICGLASRGVGMFFMHHSLFSCQRWQGFRELVGAALILKVPNELGLPMSGYQSNASHHISVTARHPATAGLPNEFDLVDEAYLRSTWAPPGVVPLLRSSVEFVDDGFFPGDQAQLKPGWKLGQWQHPPGSPVVAWANSAGHAAVVATTIGDGPSAYGSPEFRTFVRNSVDWLGSEGAAAWAQGRGVDVPAGPVAQ